MDTIAWLGVSGWNLVNIKVIIVKLSDFEFHCYPVYESAAFYIWVTFI